MPDQAAGLRSLFARRRPSLLIVAGSDASKAAVAIHFAREAAASGRATLLIDGTAGHVAMACNLKCRYELSHVIAGDVSLRDIVRSPSPNLLLMPAARALSRFGSFDAQEEARLADVFANGITQALAEAGTDTQVDLIVVHAADGQASRAVDAFGHDGRVVIVASDVGPSLRAAYAEMKVLSQRQNLENFEIVTARYGDQVPSGIAYTNLAATARRFLEIELVDGGSIALPAVAESPQSPISTPISQSISPSLRPEAIDPSTATPEEEVPHAAAIA